MSEQELLSIEEVAARLNVSVEKLNHWVKQDKFPCQIKKGKMAFSDTAIKTWLEDNLKAAHNKLTAEHQSLQTPPPRRGRSMFDFILRGGVFYNIDGATPQDVITNALNAMPLPNYCNKAGVIEQILERESIVSTALGNGVAVPHARNPLMEHEDDERIAICFLRHPIDFRALDREPVTALFIMMSHARRSHLQMLQRISFFCSQDDFIAMLKRRAQKEEIFEYLDAHRQVID